MSDKKIFAIIVTYNGETFIRQCLNSLKSSFVNVRIVVIDNASEDNTTSVIESDFPDVVLFKSDKNRGFGNANNIGIKYAYENNASHILLLNQDAWVMPETIQKLVDIGEHYPDYLVLSPVHLNKEGTDFDRGFMQYALPPFCENWFFDLFSSNQKELYHTSFVNAAAWLIKRDAIRQIGFFDPLFFHYGEDKDYCNRILFHKKKIGIVTDSIIHHSREMAITNKMSSMAVLHKEVNRNYFLKLIELKRLDNSFSKLCITYSSGLFFSSIKNILRFRFHKSLTDLLTLGKLINDIPAIANHRKECRRTGESFLASIN